MKLHGMVVFEGIAIGRVFFYEQNQSSIHHQKFPTSYDVLHQKMYEEALYKTKEDLERLKETQLEFSIEHSEIFNAHLEILQDIEVKKSIIHYIQDGFHPTKSVFLAYQTYIDSMNQLENPFMKARIFDIEDVKKRLLDHLNVETKKNQHWIDQPVILVAHEVFPSDVATFDKTKIKGIITEKGSKFSHVAIMLKNLGIPYIVGVTNVKQLFNSESILIIDTYKSELFVDPEKKVLALYEEKLESIHQIQYQNESFLDLKTTTKDHQHIEVYMNVNDLNDKALSYLPYVLGVGLFRTEFMFLNRSTMPDEKTQFDIYTKLVNETKGKPLIIRTLDIGGDKILPYYSFEKEDNPFLGKRGIRLSLEDTKLLIPQLRAILRANDGSIHVMFPMVTHIEEVKKLKKVIQDLTLELIEEGYEIEPIKVGVMIEVPSLVYMAEELIPLIDFASIGTNDLIQYLTAMDRLNPYLVNQYQTYPKVLFKVLKHLQEIFSKYGVPLSICGELASDPLMTEVLIGLGYTQLSVSYQAISEIKYAISKTTLENAKALLQKVLEKDTEEEIRQLLIKNKHN